MTTEQLQAARAEKWRQKANPLLTSEDAETWIESTGVSLFLPRKTQLQAPAPSFVEAVNGETNATPPPAAIQNAFELATRLLAAEKATPLNLLGGVSEQPDFLVSPEALPYVFSLRGDREWKRGPRDKSSPLVVDSWKLLKREGALTTSELQTLLGREVTEAAVLRSLSELWTALRVLPVYSAGEATAWELFESRHQKAMQTGGGMAQATALSALVSLYLDSAIAASTEEIEAFLSPLAPRSRIAEVVRGLAATRQLLTIQLGTQSLLHIAGGLPEFPEVEAPAEQVESVPRPEAAPRERRPFAPRSPSDRGPRRERPPFGERPAARGRAQDHITGREASPALNVRAKSGSRVLRSRALVRMSFVLAGPPATRVSRSLFVRVPENNPLEVQSAGSGSHVRNRENFVLAAKLRARAGSKSLIAAALRASHREKGFRAAKGKSVANSVRAEPKVVQFPVSRSAAGLLVMRDRQENSLRAIATRKGHRVKNGSRAAKGSAGEERREFRPRRAEGGAGFIKPFRKRTEGDERPAGKFPPRDRGPQRPPRKEWKPRPEGGAGGERREFRPRKTGESTERREFKPRSSQGGSFRPRREGSGSTGRPKPAGEKRFGEKRSFASRESREGFDRKKPPQREGREPGAKRPAKSFSKSGGRAGKSFGPPKGGGRKPAFGAKRPSRPGGKPSFGKRPNNRKGKKSGE